MLDSGSHRSLLCRDVLVGMKNTCKVNLPVRPKLVTASGEPLPMVDHIEATVEIGQLKVRHNFLVVESLVTPAILGTDFLQKHGLTLDFTVTPVAVYQYGNELYNTEMSKEVKLVWEAECQARKK